MICIDLDCTLIDSEKRYRDEVVVAAGYGISKKKYAAAVNRLYQQHDRASYYFELLYEFLLRVKPGLSKKIVDDLNALLDKNYFFPDSELFLSSFKPQQLALITTGNPHFQFRKISAHNLRKYINLIWVLADKALAISGELTSASRIGIKESFFFIDDAPWEIEAVKKAHPGVICIQVRKPASWETQRKTDFYDVYLPDLEAATHYIKANLAASS